MRYLITNNKSKPFFTKWYDYENHYCEDINMIVYDLYSGKYTKDGKNWFEIQSDHL